MSVLIVLMVLILGITLNVSAFRTNGLFTVGRKISVTPSMSIQPHSRNIKQFLTKPKKFGDIFDVVEAKYGRSGISLL